MNQGLKVITCPRANLKLRITGVRWLAVVIVGLAVGLASIGLLYGLFLLAPFVPKWLAVVLLVCAVLGEILAYHLVVFVINKASDGPGRVRQI